MNSNNDRRAWRRMIALVELDTFFAAVEQQDNPALRGRPVVVVNSEQGGRLLAVSAEARALGLEGGLPWAQAARCGQALARVVARPARYAEVTARIVAALAAVTPEVEAFAPDQIFLDLTGCQAYYRHDPARIVALVQERVRQAAGLDCAVGLSGDKTTARWAARQAGPGGSRVIPPEAAEACLAPLPLTALCGLGPGLLEFFAAHGVHRCGDMKKIPASLPARRFGNLGRRLWLMAQGRDPAPVRPREPKVLACGRLLPPRTTDPATLHAGFQQLAERLTQRLRREGLAARDFRIALRAPEGWRQAWLESERPTADAQALLPLCRRFLRQHWFGEEVQQIELQAGPPQKADPQADFFGRPERCDGNRVLSALQRQLAGRAGPAGAPAAGLAASRLTAPALPARS